MARRTVEALRTEREARASRPSAVRIALGLTGGLVLAVATIVPTLAFMPTRAAGIGYRTANTRSATLAATLDPAAPPAKVDAQIAAGRAIVARDATNIVAVRSVALLLDQRRQTAQSIGLLRLGERLSRRDALTEIALIEVAVARGSVNEALRHYDRALTTNPNTGEALLPVLAAATTDPAIANAAATIVARRPRPTWWPQFLDRMIASGPPAATARVASALALQPEEALEGWRLSAVIEKLAAAGHAPAALRLARQVRPSLTGQLADGDFERIGDLPPFDWKLVNTDKLAAVREQRDGAGGQFALSLVAASGEAGIVARRLLTLAPGVYRIRLRAGDLPDDSAGRPHVILRCASGTGEPLADAPIAVGAPSAAVTIPRGCTGQWLEFSLAGSPFDRSRTPWVDDIVVEPAP